MKRNFKKEIEALSHSLPSITQKQVDWAKEHCFSHYAYLFSKQLRCSICGRSWIDRNAKRGDKTCCPYCHKDLAIKSSRKKTIKEANYLIIATTRGEWQVLRHFYLCATICAINGGEVYLYINEVYQQWSNTEGKIVVVSRPRNYFSSSGWMLEKSMKVRDAKDHLWDIGGEVYPYTKILPLLHRNGLKSSFHGLCPAPLVRGLYNNFLYETLLKTKQYDILRVLMGRTYISHEWAINICNRNKYIVKDADLWFDYLKLLDYFHLDTHNAHYVCPKNLKKSHDMLQKRKDRKETEIRRRNEMLASMRRKDKLKKDIRYFIKHINPYIGLMFQKDGISISPLYSVSAFYNEAKIMHHCVWSNEYYTHKDCLILSAQKDGKKLETIEVNLKTYKIVQSRAVCNGTSDYHKQIIDLVNKNMNLIRRCA